MRRRLRPRSSVPVVVSTVLGCSMTCLNDLLLGYRGLDLRVRAARGFDFREIRKVAGAQREAQVEQLFFGLAGLGLEFRDRQLAHGAQIGAFHADTACSSARDTNFVPIGSLFAAR